MDTTYTKNSIVQTLTSPKKQLKAFGVEEIGLFGSYVRNEATADSDIDLLVNIRKEKNVSQFYIAGLLS